MENSELKDKLICALKKNASEVDKWNEFEGIKLMIYPKNGWLLNAVFNNFVYYIKYSDTYTKITKEEAEDIENTIKEARIKKQLETLDKLCDGK